MIAPAELKNACERYAVPIPPAVTAAEELAAATDALKTKVGAAVRPDITKVTAATVGRVVEAVVSFDTAQAVRVATVEEIDKRAAAEVAPTWYRHITALAAAFGAVFDQRAADFLTAIGDDADAVLDPARAIGGGNAARHAAATAAADDLRELRRLRDGFAAHNAPTGILPTPLDTFGRVLAISDLNTLQRIRHAAPHQSSPQWWAAVAAIPGVEIRWHSQAELIDMAQRCLRPKAAA